MRTGRTRSSRTTSTDDGHSDHGRLRSNRDSAQPFCRPDCALSPLLQPMPEFDRPLTQSIATPEPGCPELVLSAPCNLVQKPIPARHSGCESRSGHRVGQAPKVARMASDESQEQERGHCKGTKRGKDNPFCYADGVLPPQELRIGAEV